MSVALKACPFCGAYGVKEVGVNCSWVRCISCNAATEGYEALADAIAAWNRRTVTREQVIAAARALHTADANDGMLMFQFDEDADDSFHRHAAIAAFRAAGFEVAE